VTRRVGVRAMAGRAVRQVAWRLRARDLGRGASLSRRGTGRHGTDTLLLLVEWARPRRVAVAGRDLEPAGRGCTVQSGARRRERAASSGIATGPRAVLRNDPPSPTGAQPLPPRGRAVLGPLLGPDTPGVRLGDRGRAITLHERPGHGGRSVPVRRRGQPGAERWIRLGQSCRHGGPTASPGLAPSPGGGGVARSPLRRGASPTAGKRKAPDGPSA